MRRLGLTLVELILIIAIIAALVSLLVPSLQASRLAAKSSVCMSNVRQLNAILFMYAGDNASFPYGFSDNIIPPPAQYIGNAAYDRAGFFWINYLGEIYRKNIGVKTIVKCPSRQMNNRYLKNDVLFGNYGVNLSICSMDNGFRDQNEFVGKPKTCSAITRPSQTLLLVDSGYTFICWKQAADFPPTPLPSSRAENTAYIPGLSINRQRDLIQGQEIDAIYGRHPKLTVNVGYADGHVGVAKAEDLLVKKNANGSYDNRSPLWTQGAK